MKTTFVSLCLVLFLAACSPLTKQEIAKIKTVGVINNFPEYPNIKHIGATIFGNKTAEIQEKVFYDRLNAAVVKYFRPKGVAVKILPRNSSIENKQVDLVLVLTPRGTLRNPDPLLNGYGLFQRKGIRSYLRPGGSDTLPSVYIAMNISPYLNGAEKGVAYYDEGVVRADPIGQVPAKWNDLSEGQKQFVRSELFSLIDSSVEALLYEIFHPQSNDAFSDESGKNK